MTEREKKIMTTITFNKGIITYTSEENNYNYSIDINTGVIFNCRTNRENINFPPKFFQTCEEIKDNPTNDYHINNIARYMYRTNRSCNFEHLRIIDKLSSLGIEVNVTPDNDDFRKIDKEITRVAKILKTAPDNSLSTIINIMREEDTRNKLAPYCSLESPYAFYILQYWFHGNTADKRLPYVMYFLEHGLWEMYFRGEKDNLTSWEQDSLYEAMTKTLKKYFMLCDSFDKPYEKSDFFKQFTALVKNYQADQNAISTEALSKAYAPFIDKLTFEDENLKVIIPINRDDFRKEADMQHNCVYRTYLKPVIDKQTLIVFIRRKVALNTSYITCEINKRTGHIEQYRTRCNSDPRDTIAIDFRKTYQAYLDKAFDYIA